MDRFAWFRNLAAAAAFAGLAAAPARAADDAPAGPPTFMKDVAPILQKNCQDCHRPSGLNMGGLIAPMSLTTYEEVRPWVKSVAKAVKDRSMPPWHASEAQDGLFRNERQLTEQQIATVTAWAAAGAPMGDPKDAPAPLEFPKGEWALGEPDLVLTFDEPFLVADDVRDLNIDIATMIPKGKLPEDRYITALEFKPGSRVVHHIIGYTVHPDSQVDLSNSEGDSDDESVGDFGMIGGIAPGTEPERTPPGYGLLLKSGSKFVFQMHYNKEPGPGTATHDRSSVAFKFAPKGEKVQRLRFQAIGDTKRLRVPAKSSDYRITSAWQYDKAVTLTSYLPHMHLRGVYSKYVAYYPDGKQETLLEVPAWDFMWQTSYKYAEPKQLPAGTRVEVTMGYDNSAANAANPNPEEDVVWGAPTYAEMNLGWLTWSYTNPADDTGKGKAPGSRVDPLAGLAGGQ